MIPFIILKVKELIILNYQQPERSQEGKKADTEMLPNLNLISLDSELFYLE